MSSSLCEVVDKFLELEKNIRLETKNLDGKLGSAINDIDMDS